MSAKFRVWVEDEFKQCRSAEEVEDLAWNAKVHSFFQDKMVDVDDVRAAAKAFAEHFHNRRDGWECTWPIKFVVHERDRGYFAVEVERETVPEFHAGKPVELVIAP